MNRKDASYILEMMLDQDGLIFSKREAIKAALNEMKTIQNDIDDKIYMLESQNERNNTQKRKEEERQNRLPRVKSLSELQKAINERYAETGMTLIVDTCRYNGNTLYFQFGNWEWKGKKKFIGKQYFNKKIFHDCDPDGYDDPELFIREILHLTSKDFGMGGIATNWYRTINNVTKFTFDIENCD